MAKKKLEADTSFLNQDEELLDQIEEAGKEPMAEQIVAEDRLYPAYVRTFGDVGLRKGPYIAKNVISGKMAKGTLYAVVGITKYGTINMFQLINGSYVMDCPELIKM